MSAVFNFNAGPAMLPPPVLERVQAELRDYQGRGMSIMEMSHRSKEFEAVNSQAEATFKRLLGVGDGYRVLFVQGGASTQFAMVPMNFLPPGGDGRLPGDRRLGREGVRGGRRRWARRAWPPRPRRTATAGCRARRDPPERRRRPTSTSPRTRRSRACSGTPSPTWATGRWSAT